MANSPPSPYILNQLEDKAFVLRTHPFYSMFYHTNPQTNETIKREMTGLTTRNRCHTTILNHNRNNQYEVFNTIPFNLYTTDTNHGKKNIYFFSVVMLTTIVVGIVAFSYWPYVLENTSDPDFKNTMERRSLCMTILFIILCVILSVMCYELFTLRASLAWSRDYQYEQTSFYNLTMRKLSLWALMILWLVIVMTTTTILSKRSGRFKENIALNIISGMTLLLAQYLYHQSTSQFIKNLGLFLSVFTIGLILFLFYGL